MSNKVIVELNQSESNFKAANWTELACLSTLTQIFLTYYPGMYCIVPFWGTVKN